MTKQAEILSAAQSLFARFGPKKVTTDEIARDAKISKATLYKHYKNKGEIFDEVVRLEAAEMLLAIREAVAQQKTIQAKFRAHLLTKLTKIRELLNFYHVNMESGDDYWSYIADARERFMVQEREIVKEMLVGGNQSGELAVEEVDMVAHMMVGTLKSREIGWATEVLTVSLETYVDMMINIMINGIKKAVKS